MIDLVDLDVKINPDNLILLQIRIKQPGLINTPPLTTISAPDIIRDMSRCPTICRRRRSLVRASIQVSSGRRAVVGRVAVVVHDGVEGTDKGPEARQTS